MGASLGVILAAGQSRRFCRSKPLLSLLEGGPTLIEWQSRVLRRHVGRVVVTRRPDDRKLCKVALAKGIETVSVCEEGTGRQLQEVLNSGAATGARSAIVVQSDILFGASMLRMFVGRTTGAPAECWIAASARDRAPSHWRLVGSRTFVRELYGPGQLHGRELRCVGIWWLGAIEAAIKTDVPSGTTVMQLLDKMCFKLRFVRCHHAWQGIHVPPDAAAAHKLARRLLRQDDADPHPR